MDGLIFDVDGTLVDSNDAHAATRRSRIARKRSSRRAICRRYGPTVASSASKDELRALLSVAGARPFFEETTDADDAERSKPDPDIVQAAVRRLGVAAERCAMVGDTPYDAQAARQAGVAFIGVRCGGWPDERLQPALAVYDDPADFASRLRAANSQSSRSPTTPERYFSRWLR